MSRPVGESPRRATTIRTGRLTTGRHLPDVIDLFAAGAGAAVVFTATDIDDIVILTLFFVASPRPPDPTSPHHPCVDHEVIATTRRRAGQ